MATRSRERGFSLVELMVVIVIIGLLATVVGVNVIPLIFKSSVKVAQTQMKEFQAAIELFYLSEHRYPEDLQELLVETESQPGGYLKMDSIPDDPWNEAYVYTPGTARDGRITLFSKGPDKIEGTDDDVTLESERKE